MSVTITTLDAYENFGKCLKLSNGKIEALLTLEVGPRVIRLNRADSDTNLMFNDVKREHHNQGPLYDSFYYPGAQWNIYGGHRMWIAPESAPETAYPDNNPVAYEIIENGAILTPPPQAENGVQFVMTVQMDPERPEMTLSHKVTNIGDTEKEFAVWALSVMAPGGVEIIPQNTNDTGLLPNRCIGMWSYCDFSDPRLHFSPKYVSLRQDTNRGPFKMSFDTLAGTGYYLLKDTVFKKQYTPNHPNGVYADYGCSYETYTNELFLEFETLGELSKVAPGDSREHQETWTLYENPGSPDLTDDASIDAFVAKLS